MRPRELPNAEFWLPNAGANQNSLFIFLNWLVSLNLKNSTAAETNFGLCPMKLLLYSRIHVFDSSCTTEVLHFCCVHELLPASRTRYSAPPFDHQQNESRNNRDQSYKHGVKYANLPVDIIVDCVFTSLTLPVMTVYDLFEYSAESNPAVCSGQPQMLTSSIIDLQSTHREVSSLPS